MNKGISKVGDVLLGQGAGWMFHDGVVREGAVCEVKMAEIGEQRKSDDATYVRGGVQGRGREFRLLFDQMWWKKLSKCEWEDGGHPRSEWNRQEQRCEGAHAMWYMDGLMAWTWDMWRVVQKLAERQQFDEAIVDVTIPRVCVAWMRCHALHRQVKFRLGEGGR